MSVLRNRYAALLLEGVLLLCLSAIFTGASLETSRKIGRLSTIPSYDDVVYLNEASKIYYLAAQQGPVAAIGALFTRNLHAPLMVDAGVLGFCLFGPQVDRAYYMLTLVVFAMMAFVAAICWTLPPLLRVGIIVSSLALPFATMCAQQFRPDMLWATVLGGSCTLFLACERPFGQRRVAVAFGAVLGLALLIKPSTFAMTLLVMGGSWFLAALIARVACRVSLRTIGMHIALTLAAAAAVASWYWAQHAREIVEYFFDNSFGINREVWAFRGSLRAQLTYYVVPGKPLDSNLGNFFYPLLAVFLLGSVADLVRGRDLGTRLRGVAFLWMLAGTCAVNAVFGMKSPFLGGSFYGLLIFGAVWQGARLLQAAVSAGWLRSTWRQAVFAIVLGAGSAMAYSFPSACRISGKNRKVLTSVNKAVLGDLLETSKSLKAPMLVVTQAHPIVLQYLEMEFRARGRELTVISAALADRVDQVMQYTGTADYVLLQDAQMSGSPENNDISSEKLQPELNAYFRKDPGWRLAGRYPDADGKSAFLFQRVR